MSFPLIQEPSPLQQLAQLVNGLRQQAFERSQAMADQRRRDAYLSLHQQEFAANQENREWQRQNADREFNFGVDQAKVRTAATARAQQMEQQQLDQANLNNLIAQGRAALPEGYTATPEAAIDLAKGRVDLSSLPVGRPGAQGSSVRAPQMATAGGITHMPGTLSYNAPSGGGRGVSGQDLLMRAAIGGAYDQMLRMEQLEAANPMNATIPGLAATIEGAGNLPLVGNTLRGALGPLAQSQMTPEQQQYQAMAGEFIHTYASSLPGRRLGPELLRVIHHNFFPRSGQNDPATIAEFARRRREAAERMARAAYGEVQDLESLLTPENRMLLDRVSPREGVDQPAVNGTGQVVGVPAAGTSSPLAPPSFTINPRFLPR